MELRGKVAIVTGAASGMGRSMALALLQRGVSVAGVDVNSVGLTKLEQECAVGEAAFLPLATDLEDPAAPSEIVSATVERMGRVDVLVNVAGYGQTAVRADHVVNQIQLDEITPELWHRFVLLNATVPFMLTREVLPHMKRCGAGRIVTVTTSLITMLRPGMLLYGGSKAACEAGMATLAKQLEGTGMTVNVLVPGGLTNTGFVDLKGVDRASMLQPDIMVPPLLWLVAGDEEANGVRIVARDWDPNLPPAVAAAVAAAPIAWEALAAPAVGHDLVMAAVVKS